MDTQRCSHCGKEVLAQSFTLHEAHCKRNYESCECGQFVKLSDKQAHWSEKHAPKTCAHCRLEAPAYLLPLHECTNKPRVCQFCHAEISLDDFKEHLYVCSSRTQHCETCQKFIPNRGAYHVDFEHHSSICIGASSEQAASPSSASLFPNVDPELIRAQLLSEGKSPEEAEMLVAVRVAEELDRAYAEHIEHKLLMESIQAEHMEERRKVAVTNLGSRPMDEGGAPHDPSQDERSEEDALPPSTPSSALEKPEEDSSHETVSQEDHDLNEAIFKSLYEK